MLWRCPKCKREEYGPVVDRHLCGSCKTEMDLVAVVASEDGKKNERVLEKLKG